MCVLLTFMSASATPAEPTPNPDPHQDQAATDMPPGIAHLLTLLRSLIACGKSLAASVQRHTSVAGFRAINTFGTNDMALIFARIIRGLMRAAALQDMLLRRAATGRDVAPPPLHTASPRTTARVRPAARPRVVRVDDPGSVSLPTPEELAAEVRRRPIGAVLADIFTDLGITPADLEPGAGMNCSPPSSPTAATSPGSSSS